MNKKSVKNALNEDILRNSSIPSNFRLGKELFDSAKVEITESSPQKVSAKVHSATKRKVQFILNKGLLNWKCSCRLNQKKYCKHAVALGLEIINKIT